MQTLQANTMGTPNHATTSSETPLSDSDEKIAEKKLPAKWFKPIWVERFSTATDTQGRATWTTAVVDSPDLFIWIKTNHHPTLLTHQYRIALRKMTLETNQKYVGFVSGGLRDDLKELLKNHIETLGKKRWGFFREYQKRTTAAQAQGGQAFPSSSSSSSSSSFFSSPSSSSTAAAATVATGITSSGWSQLLSSTRTKSTNHIANAQNMFVPRNNIPNDDFPSVSSSLYLKSGSSVSQTHAVRPMLKENADATHDDVKRARCELEQPSTCSSSSITFDSQPPIMDVYALPQWDLDAERDFLMNERGPTGSAVSDGVLSNSEIHPAATLHNVHHSEVLVSRSYQINTPPPPPLLPSACDALQILVPPSGGLGQKKNTLCLISPLPFMPPSPHFAYSAGAAALVSQLSTQRNSIRGVGRDAPVLSDACSDPAGYQHAQNLRQQYQQRQLDQQQRYQLHQRQLQQHYQLQQQQQQRQYHQQQQQQQQQYRLRQQQKHHQYQQSQNQECYKHQHSQRVHEIAAVRIQSIFRGVLSRLALRQHGAGSSAVSRGEHRNLKVVPAIVNLMRMLEKCSLSMDSYQALEHHYTSCFSNPSKVGFYVTDSKRLVDKRPFRYCNARMNQMAGVAMDKTCHELFSIDVLKLLTEVIQNRMQRVGGGKEDAYEISLVKRVSAKFINADGTNRIVSVNLYGSFFVFNGNENFACITEAQDATMTLDRNCELFLGFTKML